MSDMSWLNGINLFTQSHFDDVQTQAKRVNNLNPIILHFIPGHVKCKDTMNKIRAWTDLTHILYWSLVG